MEQIIISHNYLHILRKNNDFTLLPLPASQAFLVVYFPTLQQECFLVFQILLVTLIPQKVLRAYITYIKSIQLSKMKYVN